MISYAPRFCVIVLLFAAISLTLACSSDSQTQKGDQSPTQNKNSAGDQAANAKPAVYEGFHDVTNCNGIMGWAWDKNRPDEPIKVDIFDGDTLLATVTAEDSRPDLLNAKIGNGRHGFTYPVPPRLKDGKPHSIRMRYAGTNVDLGNTPKMITCTFTQP